MDIQTILLIGIFTILPYLYINVYISEEVLLWEPSLGKRVLLVLILWLVPFLGAVIVNKHLGLDWFKKKNKKSDGEQGITTGLLEFDTIFNPGKKHVIEERQKEHVELKEDGQLVDPETEINLKRPS